VTPAAITGDQETTQAMAWPTTTKTRSSGSRRDARDRLVGLALGVAAVGAGLGLLLVDRIAPGRIEGLRTATVDLTASLWAGARVPVVAVSGWMAGVGDYWDAIGRARALQAELTLTRRAAAQGALFEAENRRLKQLMRFVEADQRRIAVARVAGGSGASLVETAVIGAGTVAGVRTGQPVLTDTGLMGRVTEVGTRAARVLLVSDNESRVPVRIVRTGAPAVLAGIGGGMTELRFVGSGPDAGPRAGDLIVTSGEGGLFAPDVPVARVESVRGDSARARPLARPDTLGLAVVEAAWLPPPMVPATPGLALAPTPLRMAAMVNP